MRTPHINPPTHSQSLGEWFYDNCHSQRVHHSSIPWSMVFPFAVWFLWKHRNNVVYTVKPYSPLLCDCRCLLRRFPRVQVKHVNREGNCCADALARWGCLMDDAFVVFNHPPSTGVLCLVNSDLAGMHINRTVSAGLTSSVSVGLLLFVLFISF